MEDPAGGWLERLREQRGRTVELGRLLHHRYSRLFWALHSAWALVTGVVVLVLAHNRYGFLPWVVLFIGLTWASTLFFSRLADGAESPRLRFAQGFISYLTRVMYQETLFFLLPFYFYSTTLSSWNCLYIGMLAGLAVLSCFDLVFDRLLREQRWFALGFFMIVTFSALQFFLPLVLKLRIHYGAYLAAAVSLAAAMPLAYSWTELKDKRRLAQTALALALVLGGITLVRVAIPPVPLRLSDLRFADTIDRQTLRLGRELRTDVAAEQLGLGLFVRATVFAPSRLPTAVQFRYRKDGELLRTSRRVEVHAHDRGFRVWDVLKPRANELLQDGTYAVELWTAEGQLVGRRTLKIKAQRSGASKPPSEKPSSTR
jgi:hypothetical protein